MTAQRTRLLVGEISGVHGIKGLVRIRSFTADPAMIFKYHPLTDETGGREFHLAAKSAAQDNYFLAAVEGVADRNAAEALKGQKLYVARALLPKPGAGDFYLADLIGLSAVLEDGAFCGEVVAVHNFGAGDILEIARRKPQTDTGKTDPTKLEQTFFLPFKDAFVPEIDLSNGRIVIRLPHEI